MRERPVYDYDPVDEGIRWLRGSRCWGGERYGRQSPGTGILAYQRPVIWEYFKNNFIVPPLHEWIRETIETPLSSFFSLSLFSPILFRSSNPSLTPFFGRPSNIHRTDRQTHVGLTRVGFTEKDQIDSPTSRGISNAIVRSLWRD